ncbi:MAG: glycosyltransferase family 2 protein [Erysipelotrichia bacterium]|nr:glycosyltransferase family 2 protein [Erysipelotrichia bacterium]
MSIFMNDKECSMPKVSVIIPAFNAQNDIRRCLDSVFKQTYLDYEVIVINDGSKDNTASILEEYQSKYSNMYVISQINHGQAYARNEGIKQAKGDFVCFVDSDDYVDENLLDELVKKQEQQDFDIVWCDAFAIKGSEQFKLSENEIVHEEEKKRYILNNSGPWRKLVRTQIMKEHQLFFPNLRGYEDIGVVPAYALYAKKIGYVDKALYYYMMHEGSIMHQTRFSHRLTTIFVSMDTLYDTFLKAKELRTYKEELEYLYIEHFLHAASLRFFSFFEEGKPYLEKIAEAMKMKFPHWKENAYLKNKHWKYQLICYLFYKRKYGLLKLMIK